MSRPRFTVTDIALLACLTLGSIADAGAAAGEPARAYLKLAGVQGESAQRGGEIDLVSFSIGVGRTALGAKAEFKNLRLVKAVDSTTPKLTQFRASSQQIATAVLTVPAADGSPLLTYTLSGVQVVSVTTSAGGSAATGGASAGGASAGGAGAGGTIDDPKAQVETPPASSLGPVAAPRSPTTAPSIGQRPRR